MNRRQLALGLTLSTALVAGCQAAPVATSPAATELGTATSSTYTTLATEAGPARYVAEPAEQKISYMTATVNDRNAYRANDGSLSTYWNCGAYNKPVFRAVLAASAELTGIDIKLNPNVGSYTVETSTDARSWKVALSGQKNTTWNLENKPFPAGTVGKYVRLTFANNGWNVNVYELDVMGGASTSQPAPTPTATPSAAPTAAPTAAPSTGTADPMVLKVHELVNAERAKVGAKPLALSAAINEVAEFRSTDMATRNYFSHNDPDGNSPFYWLQKYGVSYRTAGENIAMGYTSPEAVMTGWMNSSGHKANILKTSFGQIGIGIAKNSSGRIYWTQLFTD